MIAPLSARRSLGADWSATNLYCLDSKLHIEGVNNQKKHVPFLLPRIETSGYSNILDSTFLLILFTNFTAVIQFGSSFY